MRMAIFIACGRGGARNTRVQGDSEIADGFIDAGGEFEIGDVHDCGSLPPGRPEDIPQQLSLQLNLRRFHQDHALIREILLQDIGGGQASSRKAGDHQTSTCSFQAAEEKEETSSWIQGRR